MINLGTIFSRDFLAIHPLGENSQCWVGLSDTKNTNTNGEDASNAPREMQKPRQLSPHSHGQIVQTALPQRNSFIAASRIAAKAPVANCWPCTAAFEGDVVVAEPDAEPVLAEAVEAVEVAMVELGAEEELEVAAALAVAFRVPHCSMSLQVC